MKKTLSTKQTKTVKAAKLPKITKLKKKGRTSKFVKIEAKPLDEEQIQQFLKYFNENGSFPGSKIPCNMTGKLTTCVGPWMTKKIKEFGGAENLLRKYKCRGALKNKREALKPVKKKHNQHRKEVLSEMKDDQQNWDIPKMSLNPPQKSTDGELAAITRGACLRPDIFLNNHRYCNGCEFYNVCTNVSRGLLKESLIRKKYGK